MPNSQISEELLQATRTLSNEVHDLSGRLTAKELLHKRTRTLTKIAMFIAISSVIGGSFSGYIIYQDRQDAKTTCLNANESRQAQATIWGYVYAANENEPGLTKEEKQAEEELIRRLEAYTNEVFAQRDCDDLSKEYKLPPPPIPPEITEGTEQ